MQFLVHLLIYTLAIFASAYILPGIEIKGFWAALVTAIVLGFINFVVRPILILLTLPLNILTLGLFIFVINALLVMLASVIVPGFHVANFWWAFVFSLVLSILNYFLNSQSRRQRIDNA